MMEVKNDGWIEWHGGDCPIKSDKTLVDYRLANSIVRRGIHGRQLRWSRDMAVDDIISYRITENHEPADTAPIDMSQNRVPCLLLTDEEQAAFSAWRADGGAVERWWPDGWEPVSQSFDLGGMMICRTVSTPVITETTHGVEIDGHTVTISITRHDGKPISGTVAV